MYMGGAVGLGAAFYYEYPNVWMYVFLCKYLGVRRGFDCDLVLDPLFDTGSVCIGTCCISFDVQAHRITAVRNTGEKDLTVFLPAEGRRVYLPAGQTYTGEDQ